MKNFLSKVIITVAIISSLLTAAVFAGQKQVKPDLAICVYAINSDKEDAYISKVINEIDSVKKVDNAIIHLDYSKNTEFTDFLIECNKNVNAGRKILVVIGDGMGVYGINRGKSTNLTLSELKNSFAMAFNANPDFPPFDIAMFDANLFATVEMGQVLYGYAKYFIAPESIAYKSEGFYKDWLDKLVANPNVNSIDLGTSICDKYFKMLNGEVKNGRVIASGLSLMDVAGLKKSYTHYLKFIKDVVKKLPKDNLLMADFSKSVTTVIETGETIDDFKYNLFDFMDFVDNLRAYEPVDTANIKRALEKAIVYSAMSALDLNKCGVSIYFPLRSFDKHMNYMNDYVNNFSKDLFLKVFYNYKMTGEVSAENEAQLKKQGISKIKKLNFRALDNFSKLDITHAKGSLKLTLKLPKEMKELFQDAYLKVYKREGTNYVYYNEDSFINLDKHNNIVVNYDARWAKINDVPLYLNVVTDNYDFTKYSTGVRYNNMARDLYIAYSNNNPKIVGLIDTDKSDNLFSCVVNPLKNGDKVGIYKVENEITTGLVTASVASDFIYNDNYKIEPSILADGEYTAIIVLTDIQGKKHESDRVLFNIHNRSLHEVNTEKKLFNK